MDILLLWTCIMVGLSFMSHIMCTVHRLKELHNKGAFVIAGFVMWTIKFDQYLLRCSREKFLAVCFAI